MLLGEGTSNAGVPGTGDPLRDAAVKDFLRQTLNFDTHMTRLKHTYSTRGPSKREFLSLLPLLAVSVQVKARSQAL